MSLQYVSQIIEAIGVILVAFWSYNQYTKNKLTDKKVEDLKRKEEEKLVERNDVISRIYFDLYRLLIDLKASRVYIIQPHPLIINHYITVCFEVKQKGISEIKPHIQNVPIAEIAEAVDKMTKRDWLFYRDIESEMFDKRFKSFLRTFGSSGIFIRKMSVEKYGWVGSLVVDFIDDNSELGNLSRTAGNIDYIKSAMLSVAENIQYILPPVPNVEKS